MAIGLMMLLFSVNFLRQFKKQLKLTKFFKSVKKGEKLMSEFLAAVAPKLRLGIALKLRYCLS